MPSRPVLNPPRPRHPGWTRGRRNATQTEMKSRLLPLVLTAFLPAFSSLLSAAESAGGTRPLFDGVSLAGWRPSAFDSQAAVKIEPAFRGDRPAIILEKSDHLSGISRTDGENLPKTNYELSLEAMRLAGGDFFCGLTFPVGDSACTLVVGGWGGMVVGISCIDNADASENETTTSRDFRSDRWYKIRLRVTPKKLEAWIDEEKAFDFETEGRRLDLRFGEIKHSLPLGFSAYETRAALRDIKLRILPPEQ